MSKQKDNLPLRGNESAGGEILLYQTGDGDGRMNSEG